jgi:hypothetical protein
VIRRHKCTRTPISSAEEPPENGSIRLSPGTHVRWLDTLGIVRSVQDGLGSCLIDSVPYDVFRVGHGVPLLLLQELENQLGIWKFVRVGGWVNFIVVNAVGKGHNNGFLGF